MNCILPGSIRIISLALAVILAMIAMPHGLRAQEPYPDIPYAVYDATSGEVLAQNRINERWHPASLTKLMTAYVTFRAIADGEISAGSPVHVTQTALSAPPSRMGYPKGTVLRFDTALRILVVKSANDVAIAVAESLAGSVDAFVERMNGEATRLGLLDTRFVNPNGLHDNGQYVSARDLIVLSGAIWNEFPQYRSLFETPTIQAGDRKFTSYNLLLERFDGTTGMKTGFVCASGYNIVASAERTGRRLVAVVLGASSQTERAVLAARLLLDGFDTAQGKPLAALERQAAPSGPENMRSTMCSEAARQARYDPAAETAVIDSPFLHPRRVTQPPVVVSTGGVDGNPSPGWLSRAFMPSRVPVPLKRPDYEVVGVDGDLLGSAELLRGTIPIPEPRPRAVQ